MGSLSESAPRRIAAVIGGNQAVMDANLRTPGSKGTRSAMFHLSLIKDDWKINDFGV